MKALQALVIILMAAAASGCERNAPTAPPAQAPVNVTPPASVAPDSFAPIVKQVSPAVVSIDTLAPGADLPFVFGDGPPGLFPDMGQGPVRRGSGSGFLISADGYVVTNNHVIDGAREIIVTLADQRQLPARLVGRDPPTDLAVLKIDTRDQPYVSFAKSAVPEVGDWVVAVGSPFGLGGTATAGIVSARSREVGEAYVSYLQIDAPINSGNSGGPSFDLQGRVVGVNTAIFSPTGGSVGIGFAIPAELADQVTQQLVRNGRVTRGYLGVSVGDLTPGIAARLGIQGRRGAVIYEITRGSPAAGVLRARDVVVAVNGEPVTGAATLTRRIADAAPGQKLALQVLRDAKPVEVSVVAIARPAELTS